MQKLLWLLLLITNLAVAQEEATLLGKWSDNSLLGSTVYDNIYNEVWGVAIDGKEYAVIGSTAGTHFIDVTHPSAIFEAFFIRGRVDNQQIIHRDYHDYKGYLYAVADEGESSLQILNLNCLPDTVVVEYDKDDLIKRAHNIFIDDATGLLYAFATRNRVNGFAMRIFSLENPIEPQFIAEHKVFGNTTIGHVHDGYVHNNIAYLNCGNDGLFVVDFSDPLNPVTIASLDDYPDKGYNHSGWPSVNGQYYYLADENHGFDIKVLDITNLDSIKVDTLFDAASINQFSMPHNQVVACDYLYVSYYFDGLQVYDISNPKVPERVMHFDTYLLPHIQSYKGAWGVYPFLPSGNILVSDMQTGLYVFEAIDGDCAGRMLDVDEAYPCDRVSSIENSVLQDDLSLFPNPIRANEILRLEFGSAIISECLLSIYSSVGALHFQQTLELESSFLELPIDLETGCYFLELKTNENRVVQPFVVE